MDNMITGYVSALQCGELQLWRNMAVIPLFTSANYGPDYVVLKEALSRDLIKITEIGRAGSVPELQVVNTSELPVLLLEGEELVGAKQNRVLNTTILLKGLASLRIPVSCTESGRWSYASDKFADSGVITPRRIRSRKTDSVTRSLKTGRSFKSDQGDVWRGIAQMQSETGTRSSTNAMRDVYQFKATELDEYARAFSCMPHQRGLLVLINGKVAGLDALSREAAYTTLHLKLVKSYAMDALIQADGKAGVPTARKAKLFLNKLAACQSSQYVSPGQGEDYRLEGEKVAGSALVVDESVIHLACFSLDTRGRRTENGVMLPE